MASGKFEECKQCEKRNNKLACLLKDCEIRNRHEQEIFTKWKKEWQEKKICFGCKHCKCRWTYDHSYKSTESYCELTGKIILGEDTCERFEIE